MQQWDVEIGRTLHYNLPTKVFTVEPGDELTLLVRDRSVEVYRTYGSIYLGELYDVELREKLKSYQADDRFFFADAVRVLTDEEMLHLKVMFPGLSVKSEQAYTLLVTGNVYNRASNIMSLYNLQMDVLEFLRDLMLYRGRYLCLSRRAGKETCLITPRHRFFLRQDEGRNFTALTHVVNLDHGDYFKTALLVRCDLRLVPNEAQVGEDSQGLGDLLRPEAFASKYFELWHQYRDEEQKNLKDMAEKLKDYNLKYQSVREEGNEWVFEISGEIPSEWFEVFEESGQVPVSVKMPHRHPTGDFSPNQDFIIGNITRLTKSQLRTNSQKQFLLPRQGEIGLSLQGDLSIHNRWQKALERMQQGQAEIGNLEQILSQSHPGRPVISDRAALSASTPTLLEGLAPLEKQREAIKKALNTPDICLIQGPPGTGKTSVIRTLVKRIKEEMPNSRILLTSYQHSAVDNAIAGLYQAGVVSCRLDASREENPESYEDMLTWTKTVAENCRRGMVERGEDKRLERLQQLEEDLKAVQLG